MKFKFTAALTALAFAAAGLAPAPAFARDHDGYRGGYGSYHGGYRGDRYRYDRHDDAVAAGVVGLVLGLAIGAAASNPGPDRHRCYDRCGNYGPQQGYNEPYRGGSAYEQDYGQAPPDGYSRDGSCVRPAQQWDPYSGTYVWVNVRMAC